ncbi:hypothetical protein CEV31_2244 [Brucella thiophenivorans]|uniref:Uncharacterized protein n=1 Tax=Brucella thiophenivorans TaxID=571255 RepID=A0A256FVP4_9HYPH|nr:hypothetical protein CEV31_2244 [Brucella thiophenivorans]
MGISCFGGPSCGLQVLGKGNARCLAEHGALLNAQKPLILLLLRLREWL